MSDTAAGGAGESLAGGAASTARPDATGTAPDVAALARVVFALLVVACLAAFLITQRLKHTPTVVQEFKGATAFTPYLPGPNALEAISFKIERTEPVTVTIIDSSGDTVATLVRDYPLKRYTHLSLRWNGRRGQAHGLARLLSPSGRVLLVPRTDGPVAPAGEYRVRVKLAHRGTPVLSPYSFTLVGR